MVWQEHEVIWLQPWCDKCETESNNFANDGRQWCQDNVWEPCDLCERKPVRYIIDRRQKRQ